MNIRISLYPKQKLFWKYLFDGKTRIIGFGGAKKGGKSYIARIGTVVRAMKYPGTYHLLLRQTIGDIKKNHLADIRRFLVKNKIKFRWDKDERFFELLDYTYEGVGSRVYLGYAEDVIDAERYQGTEWLTIMFDEATQFAEDVVYMITNENVVATHCPPGTIGKVIYTCNPIGIGKRWMYQNVVLPGERGEEGIVWIHANFRDNKAFMRANPLFEQNMRRQHIKTPWIADALLDGNWHADPDKFYPFDDKDGGVHVLKKNVPYFAKWYAGVDYGYSASAFVTVYIAHWKDRKRSWNRLTGELEYKEHWHVVDEVVLYYADLDVQAQTCLDKEQELRATANMPPVIERFADPASDSDMASVSNQMCRSVRDAWDAHGFVTIPAQKRSKYIGLQMMREKLHKEIMSFDPRCVRCIQEFTDAVHQKDRNGRIMNMTDPNQQDDCLIAGTLVTTQRGDIPIEEVVAGDYALTRKGYQRITRSWMKNADKDVYEVTFSNGRTLTGTSEHPVLVEEKGFTRLDALRYNDVVLTTDELSAEVRSWNHSSSRNVLFTIGLKKSSSMESFIGVILTPSMDGLIDTSMPAELTKKRRYTEKFGSITTEQFRQGITFTTKTAIPVTTILTISNVLVLMNTTRNMIRLSALNAYSDKQTSCALPPPNGMVLRRVGRGTRYTELKLGATGSRKSILVNTARKSSCRERAAELSSVPMLARQQQELKQEVMLLPENVSAVESNSKSTNTNSPKIAPVRVVAVQRAGRENVYNLTVDGLPEFFANGILVHNCQDAVRYPTAEVFLEEIADPPQSAYDDLYLVAA